MNVNEFIDKLSLKVVAGKQGADKEITGVYICDLLSWVMSHAQKGNIWITVQTNINVIAVAVLTEVSCIVIPEDIEIDKQTINKANSEGIVLLSSSLNSYQISCLINKNEIFR